MQCNCSVFYNDSRPRAGPNGLSDLILIIFIHTVIVQSSKKMVWSSETFRIVRLDVQ